MMFENIREVEINSVNGEINIEAWDNNYAEVSYIPHGEVEVEIEEENGKLIVREKPKKRKILGIFSKSSNGWAEIEIRIPKGIPVKARNVNGELKARGVTFKEAITVNGTLEIEGYSAERLSSVNGFIKAHLAIAGPLNVATVNGSIEVTIEELEGNVTLGTVNGDVKLYLTDFCDAKISVKKRVNGNIELVGIDEEEPVIGTGTFEVSVGTVNGDVRVELI